MRFRIRLALAIGCVSLLVLSDPAFSLPAPGGVEADQRAPTSRAVQKKKTAQRAPKHKKANHAARQPTRQGARSQANRAPVTEYSQRAVASSKPPFGWPSLVSEARKYLGTNPTDRKRLWCATFMNLVLGKLGYAGTNSDAAKSFAQYGRRISEPRVGAIAVLTRGKRGGHVGVVSGIDARGNPIIISGNHNKRVGEATYPRARVIAYVMPTDSQPQTQVAERGTPSHSSEPGLASPIAELLAAIEAEQSRPETRAKPARPPEPPVPHRTVQQMPEQTPQAPQPRSASRSLPLDPALAELLGIKDRSPSAQPPRPAPQRQQRVQQHQPGRVAAADTGVAGARGLH